MLILILIYLNLLTLNQNFLLKTYYIQMTGQSLRKEWLKDSEEGMKVDTQRKQTFLITVGYIYSF